MKHTVLFICLLLVSNLQAKGQSCQDSTLSILYDTFYRLTKERRQMKDETTRLDIAENGVSHFYSGIEYRRESIFDSVYASGGDVWDGLEACKQERLNRSSFKTEITKNYPQDGLLLNLNDLFGWWGYKEPMPSIEWSMMQGDTILLGYKCEKASTRFRGKTWTAWFTPDIPISEGPWKLHGLPGLILLAEDSCGDFAFSAKGIEKTKKAISLTKKKIKWTKQKEINDITKLEWADRDKFMDLVIPGSLGHYDQNGKRIIHKPETACLLEPEPNKE